MMSTGINNGRPACQTIVIAGLPSNLLDASRIPTAFLALQVISAGNITAKSAIPRGTFGAFGAGQKLLRVGLGQRSNAASAPVPSLTAGPD